MFTLFPFFFFLLAAVGTVVVGNLFWLGSLTRLLDPRGEAGGLRLANRIHGHFRARASAIELRPPVRRRSPAELRVSMACTTPLEMRLLRESTATAFQKAIGFLSDWRTGHAELDRVFVVSVSEGRRATEALAVPEVRDGLLALAHLGIYRIELQGGRLLAAWPMRFYLPPGRDVVARILDLLATVADRLEGQATGTAVLGPASAGTIASPPTSVPLALPIAPTAPPLARPPLVPAALEPEFDPTRRPIEAALSGPRATSRLTGIAFFFLAFLFALLVIEPLWSQSASKIWSSVATALWQRVIAASVLGGLAGVVAGWLAGGNIAAWGLGLSWPLFLHAGLVWLSRYAAASLGGPVTLDFLRASANELMPVLQIVTLAPVSVGIFATLGASLGKSLRGRSAGADASPYGTPS